MSRSGSWTIWTGSPTGTRSGRDWSSTGRRGIPGCRGASVRVALPGGGEPSLSLTVEPGGRSGDVRFPPIPSWIPRATVPGRREDPAPDRALSRGPGLRRLGRQRAGRAAGRRQRARRAGGQHSGPPGELESGDRRGDLGARGHGRGAGERCLGAAGAGGGEARSRRARALEQGAPQRRGRLGVAESPIATPCLSPTPRTACRGPGSTTPQGWLKIEIAANGIYRLSRRALSDAGVSVDLARSEKPEALRRAAPARSGMGGTRLEDVPGQSGTWSPARCGSTCTIAPTSTTVSPEGRSTRSRSW